MMGIVPAPDEDDIPVNEPLSADVGGQQKATFEFEVTQNVSKVMIPIVAATKFDQSSYKVKIDGRTIYGPKEVPPTELDDKAVCFLPARSFSQKLTVVVHNLRASGSAARTYHVQPIGYEVSA